MQENVTVKEDGSIEGYLKDLSLRSEQRPDGAFRVYIERDCKTDVFLGLFIPANLLDQLDPARNLTTVGAEKRIQDGYTCKKCGCANSGSIDTCAECGEPRPS